MCVNYSNFSAGCLLHLVWFFISSTHNSYCTYIISQFVTNDSSFVLGLLCYCWLSFHSYESSLHKSLYYLNFWFVHCLFFFFSLACVYLLCSHLPCCTCDGWVPILDFYLQDFSSSKLFKVKKKTSLLERKLQYVLFLCFYDWGWGRYYLVGESFEFQIWFQNHWSWLTWQI